MSPAGSPSRPAATAWAAWRGSGALSVSRCSTANSPTPSELPVPSAGTLATDDPARAGRGAVDALQADAELLDQARGCTRSIRAASIRVISGITYVRGAGARE